MTGPEKHHTKTALPAVIPLFPLAGAVLLPGGELPLNIFEPRYLAMTDDALAGSRLIGMIQPKGESGPHGPTLYDVGCAGRITSFMETGDGRYLVTLTGLCRFRLIEEAESATPYRQGRADWDFFDIDLHNDLSVNTIDRDEFLDIMQDYLSAEGLKTDWDAAASAPIDALVVSLAMGCPFAPNEKQALLEAMTVADRAECLMALMEISGAEATDNGQRLQ